MHTDAIRDLDEHRAVLDVRDVLRRNLRHVESEAEDIPVGLAKFDKARDDEEIDELGQIELADAVLGQLASFVADGRDLEAVADCEVADHVDHIGIRLGLVEHELSKVLAGERARLVKDNAVQVLWQCELTDFVGVEREVMPLVNLVAVQSEFGGRAFTRVVVPPVGQKDAAQVQE